VVPGDVRLQMWLAFGFLAVCLLNTVGLLLAKFLRRSREIGVRRALGRLASRDLRAVPVEAGTVGLAAACSAWAWRCSACGPCASSRPRTPNLAHLDPSMLVTTFVLAIAASILAGIVPAWHACQVTPAVQLKSQ
jgi:putative ABC transport system permease protein